MNNVVPVVLCGGSGTRLWPLSRAGFPKQFLSLSGTSSLFQQSVERVNDLAAEDIYVGDTLVVTNEEHRFLALDQLRELPEIAATLLLESIGRNTAPALTLSALHAQDESEDPILVVAPADQVIADEAAFRSAVQRAIRVAASGVIVILGIQPDSPATGYGYIRHSGAAGAYGEYRVAQFVEKPSRETAKSYIDSGEYTWNSGIFVLRASVWVKALGRFRSDILTQVEAAWAGRFVDASFVRPDGKLFADTASESIDYAVMEKCPGSDIVVNIVPLDAGWSDLGAWDAVWQVGEQDANGNVAHGDSLLVDTVNTLIHSSSRLVGTLGVEDLVIVETADAVLVADRRRTQDVKKITAVLTEQCRGEQSLHRKVHRPWGWYDSIDEAERFKVKRILVKPGAKLSLQKHYHRAEHWIVVRGTAEVTCGNNVLLLTENQSTYIPLGEVHRLSNPGSIPLEIIEIQSGSYLGEDDIVRFEDNYGRMECK